MNFDRRLTAQLWTAAWLLAAVVLIGFGGGLLTIFQAQQLSRLVARVFLGGEGLKDVWPVMRLILGIVLLRGICAFAHEVLASTGAARIKAHLRRVWLEKIFRLGPVFVRSRESGALSAQAVEGVEAVDAYFSQFLPQLALAVMIPLLILMLVFPLDELTGIVLLLTAPLIPLFMILIGRSAETLTRRQWTTLKQMSAFFLDTIQGLNTLKELGQSRAQTERIAGVSQAYRQATIQVLRVTFLSALVLEMVGTISTAVVSVEIGLRLLYGRLAFEQAFLILLLAPEFYLPLRLLGQRFHAGMTGVTAAKTLFALLDQPDPHPALSGAAVQVDLDRPFAISFDGVTFQYADAAEPVLEKVDLQIASGQQIALIGPSGAGKTTLAALLLQFVQPTLGRVEVNGHNLASIAPQEWRQQIGWISQQPYLFPGTIEENIRLGKPLATQTELERAVELSGLAAFLSTQPNCLAAPLGERGRLVSGGQAQRIALARAILRDAPLLIVDEPTAQLDPELEAFLIATLRNVYAGRTVVMIAHRLASIRGADRVVVIEQGKITGQGCPAELARLPGFYADLLAGQGSAN